MHNFIKVLTIFLFLIFNYRTSAEEVFYLEDKTPISSMREKIRHSYDNASYIAEGYFSEPKSKQELRSLDKSLEVIDIDFHATKRFDGNKDTLNHAPLHLKIIAYRPLPTKFLEPDSTALELLRKIENDSNGKIIDLRSYRDMLSAARAPLLTSQNYMEKFFIVPIAAGNLDAHYRTTDVVVNFGSKYIIFIMRNISNVSRIPLFENNIDIYPADEPELRALINRPDQER